MSGAIDHNTLRWVKQELDETLKQARQALEAHVETPEDEAQLRFCAVHLHQVYGTLQMVELYGAGMLAEELEQVVLALDDGRIPQQQEALELLMRGILQLPDYLDRIAAGHADIPLVLLPLMNDLRAIRGEKLLSENALFSPDLQRPLPAEITAETAEEPLAERCRRLRHPYQLALLGWFRDKAPEANLKRMGELLAELRAAAVEPAARTLFWVAGGVTEALAGGRLETSMSVRLLLGQVERQVKRLIDEGEPAFAAEPPQELIKNLLFYVARSEPGSTLVDSVRQTYGLASLLPDEEEISRARDSLSGHNLALIETVSAAVREDLAQVKDALDLFTRGGRQAAAELAPAGETLNRIADTLGMLGLGSLREQVLAQARQAMDIVEGRQQPDEEVLMAIAGALLSVESSLDGLLSGAPVAAAPADAGGEATVVPEAEFSQVCGVLAEEAIRDIARAKEAILAFIENPADVTPLEPVAGWFHQIQGGLLLLNETRAAALLESVADYIGRQMLDGRQLPGEAALDHLADSISSLEYYLENLQQQKVSGESILEVAQRSVEALLRTLPAVAEVEALPASDEEVIEALPVEDLQELDMAPAEELIELPAAEADGEMLDLEMLTADDGEATIELVDLEPAEAADDAPPPEVVSEEQPQAEAGDAPAFDLPYPVLEGSEVDEEILEIFIEEAEEELANIREALPRWQADTADQESLTLMRRSFHTLKGSGRLVGAMLIGEFAWAFENMLNRVIDGTIDVGDEMPGLLERAAEALPQLIGQLQGGQPPRLNVGLMMEKAEALSRGEAIDLGDLEPVPAAVAPLAEVVELPQAARSPEAMASELQEAASAVDPQLYEIFCKESADHLAVIREHLAACERSSDDCRPTEGLIRALHTLHGSARMAGADAIAAIAAGLERYGKALMEHGQPLTAEQRPVIGMALDMIDALLPRLIEGEAEVGSPALQSLLERLASLPQSLEAAQQASLDELPAADEPEVIELTPAAGDETPDGAPEVVEIEITEAAAEQADEVLDGPSAEDGLEVQVEETAGSGEAEAGAPVPEAPDEVEEIPLEEVAVEVPAAESAAGEPAEEGPDAELIEVFLEEGDEILESSELTLQKWIQSPGDAGLIASLQRDLHTLKGGARMASLDAISDLSHQLESLLIAVDDGRVVPSTALFDLLLAAQDRLVQMIETVRAGHTAEAAGDLLQRIESLRRGEAVEMAPVEDAVATVETEPVEPAEAVEQAPAAETAVDARAEDEVVTGRGQQEMVRVQAELLDNMVNYAGEISIYRARLEQQVGSFRFNLGELGQTVDRLREQLRKLEIETEAQVLYRYERDSGDEAHPDFDPLEMDRYSTLQTLSRSMMESIGDLVSLQNLLENVTRESETLLVQQSRVNTELQEGLMRTRMVPFSRLAPRMRRIVRQACQELGKRAELSLEGAEGEIDRTVIDRIVAPLEHMLRNAVAHGIEPPAQREAAGKRSTGSIRIKLQRDGSDVVITVADDGAGMDLQAIRDKARERGLIAEDASFSDNEVMQFVLETGFSTATEVSQIAGRGVGMDVVNNEVKQLGGTLHIDSTPGQGTTFTIRLPFTLAINQALLVQVHEDVYAIPLTGIEGVVRMTQEQLRSYYEDPSQRFEYAGYEYELRHLGAMLGHGEPHLGSGMPKRLPVLLVRAGDHHMALQVEALLGSRETVVKSVGPQISTVRGISGATILGDGRVVLILDLGGLVRAGAAMAPAAARVAPQAEPELREKPLVMVVDDSITVRKVTSRLLERNEMQALTAKDGVDAVAKLQEHLPDLMLLDIEMPRMDGFELATHIRNEPRLQHIPIIMITSRTGEKHRTRALEIGVNRYLGKPFQETELLESIQELLEEQTAHA
ncbi:Hpt domain-containing protein [Thiohalobacter sp. IOR34]|uniref:hybrid sensor histidine kinase/response regulator n=1 Tax=Thiohalobacter sp. IOR34 TaxID=3057176 RepID=UPI0025AEDACA|nr:Hpt domain-containing protein [Thiohalobacter sp. IOR34]WJW75796.1 Hpt domain-containing protein [Thiohalobacter sp. IOR34]